MLDWEGISMDCPHPHCHHIGNWIHQTAHIEGQQLVDGVCYLYVCNLHDEKWRCKFLSVVLPYRKLCFSCRVAKCTSLHFKFCLYIVNVLCAYFSCFSMCNQLIVHQNLRTNGSGTYKLAISECCHHMQMRPKQGA